MADRGNNVRERHASSLVWARWIGATIAITYGCAKLNGAQFTILDSELTRPLGEVSGFWLTWYYFGYSTLYKWIIAGAEIVGGILLSFRRTAVLGALTLLPLTANIVLIDVLFGVDLGGLVAAVALLYCVGLVLRPAIPALKVAVIANHATPAGAMVRRLMPTVTVIVLAFGFTWWVARMNNRAPTVIDGVWGVVRSADAEPPWRQIFFERNRAHLAVFRGMNGQDAQRHFEMAADGQIQIWSDWLERGTLLMNGRLQDNGRMMLRSVRTPNQWWELERR